MEWAVTSLYVSDNGSVVLTVQYDAQQAHAAEEVGVRLRSWIIGSQQLSAVLLNSRAGDVQVLTHVGSAELSLIDAMLWHLSSAVSSGNWLALRRYVAAKHTDVLHMTRSVASRARSEMHQ